MLHALHMREAADGTDQLCYQTEINLLMMLRQSWDNFLSKNFAIAVNKEQTRNKKLKTKKKIKD